MPEYTVAVRCTSFEYFSGIEADSPQDAIAQLRREYDARHDRPDCNEDPAWEARATGKDGKETEWEEF